MLRLISRVYAFGAKKAKVEQVATSDDLINIFKDRQDPEIKDIDEYPLWLLELALPLDHALSVPVAYQTNDKPMFTPRSHFRSILRGMQRERVMQMNEYKQMTSKKETIDYDDLFDETNALEAMQQEKYAAELAAQEAAAEADDDDDEDGPKVKKPAITKEVDDDDKKAAPAGDKAKAGGAADKAKAPPAGGAAKKK